MAMAPLLAGKQHLRMTSLLGRDETKVETRTNVCHAYHTATGRQVVTVGALHVIAVWWPCLQP